MAISLFDRVENRIGKGENAVYQHLLFLSQYFQKSSVSGLQKKGTMR